MRKILIVILLLISLRGFSQSLVINGTLGTSNGVSFGLCNSTSGNSFLNVPANPVSSYDTSALRFFASMTVQMPDTMKVHVNKLILALKSTYCMQLLDSTTASDTTLWQRMDEFWLLCLHDTNSFLGVKGYKNCANTYTKKVTLTPYKSFQGGGATDSAVLTTNYNPFTDGVNFKYNYASISMYSRSATGSNINMGVQAGAPTIWIYNGLYYEINSGNQNSVFATTQVGLITVTRPNATTMYLAQDKLFKASSDRTSSNVLNGKISVNAWNLNGANRNWSSNPISFAQVGGYFSQPDVRNLYIIIVTNFLIPIGAN